MNIDASSVDVAMSIGSKADHLGQGHRDRPDVRAHVHDRRPLRHQVLQELDLVLSDYLVLSAAVNP